MRLLVRLPAVLVALATLLAVVGGPLAAAAQVPAAAPVTSSQNQEAAPPPEDARLRDLLGTLENEASRKEFLDKLRTALEAQDATADQSTAEGGEAPGLVGAELLSVLSATLGKVSAELAGLATLAHDLPAVAASVLQSLDTPQERAAFALGLGRGILAVLAGLLAHVLVLRLLARPQRALLARPRSRWVERVVLLVGRLILCAIPPVATVAAAWGTLPLLQAGPETMTATVVTAIAIAVFQVVMALARTLFSPGEDAQRLLPITDETAHYLVIWVRRMTLVGVIGYFGLQGAVLLGLAGWVADVLQTVLGLLLAAMVILFIFQNRHGVAAVMRRRAQIRFEGQTRRSVGQRLLMRMADIWHVLAAFYVAAIFIVWAAEIPGGFLFMLHATLLSGGVVILGLLASQGLDLAIGRVFHISDEAKRRFPGLENRANRYLPILTRVLRGLLWLIVALGILQIWGLDTLIWLTEGSGRRLTGAAITIGLVVLVSVVVWEVTSTKIQQYFSETDADGNIIERSARAKTLLPLMRNVLLVALIIIVTLIVLAEIGVNIAPLLAGAGVIGLAIGFGSQKLVQDVITGAFILFEDTMAVGDVVQVGGHAGVVESLSIRSLRLRDLSGSVHTVPFSSVDTIVNMTKDFSYYLMEVGVAYREDTDEVAAVLNEIAEEMRAEDYFGPLILEPLEILGVDKFADSAVILKARIKTLPIRQWEVGREFNRRMKKAFDTRGIEIPFPHRTLYFGVDKQGKAPPARIHMDDTPPLPDDTIAPPTPLAGPQTSETPDGDH